MHIGVVRYSSVARAIGEALNVYPAPDCRIGHGRITLTFRSLGASVWSEEQKSDFAIQVAAIARSVLAADKRRAVRKRVRRAIVVVFEDAGLLRGCTVESRWECVVPVISSAELPQRAYQSIGADLR
jgi:hypothetical protein